MKKYLVLVCLLVPFFSNAQGGSELYSNAWHKADSLMDGGFPESSMKIIDSVYQQAKVQNQQVYMLKAQLYIMAANVQKNQDAPRDAILRAEKETESSTFPVSAVWQNITAQLYWNYYVMNRWKILDRTRTASGGEDFEQWDAQKFYAKIADLYKRSLSNAGELKKISIADFDPVITKGVNTRHLRPTLFDLLAFNAIAFYQNDEKDIIDPVFKFEMDDAAAFADANEFMAHSFKSEDTTSLHWKALQLYQQILSLHSNDESPDAFIDADLHRLDFAFTYSVRTDKKELYVKALQRLETKYSSNPLSGLAAFKRAMQMHKAASDKPTKKRYPGYYEENNYDYVGQKSEFERIISKFPGSEGAVLATYQLNEILNKVLNLEAEETVLPNEPSKFLVRYRNVPNAYFRIVKLTPEQYKIVVRRYDEKRNATLLAASVVKSWQADLPGTQDYEMHTTEIKADPLAAGAYAILVSAKPGFEKENNILAFATFQATFISMVTSSRPDGGIGYVLNRKTGTPIANALVTLYKENYDNNTGEEHLVKGKELKSNNEGVVENKNTRIDYYSGLSISANSEQYFQYGSIDLYSNNRGKPGNIVRCFLFTDRSIYRPGQTIYFKGIMVNSEDGGRKNAVMPNHETEVTFYDVNSQKITSVNLKTNEYGSFTGTFTAPASGLTGSMRISNDYGVANISVEEYKRPKFSVSFEELKGTYTLNEEVKVIGKAEAYAGNNVDGAQVKYRVTRSVIFPYYWLQYSWHPGYETPEAEIANGTATTDKDGKFTVSFIAKPDLTVSKSTLPTFTYAVHADVTDVNGETRSADKTINAGYTSIQLSAAAPEKAGPQELDTINIRSQNLNGQFVPAQVQVRISLLKAPAMPLRKRLWEVPDQFVMDEVTFRQYFPADEYKNEADHLNWEKSATILEKTITTTEDGNVAIDARKWNKNGWYVIELETKDKNGILIAEKKYVQVWDENNAGNITDALAVLPQTITKQPGENATINVVSGYKELHLIQDVQTMDGGIVTSHINYQKPYQWIKQIEEKDRGGMIVSYFAVKDNRIYQYTTQVNVPWSNKDLNISWETHRDKLQPGQKETWTMVVSGPKKEKVTAEMVATLYDASLDAYRPHSWGVYGLNPFVQSQAYYSNQGFGISRGMQYAYYTGEQLPFYQKRYDVLIVTGEGGSGYATYRWRKQGISEDDVVAVEDPETGEQEVRIVRREFNASAQTMNAVPAASPFVKFTPPVLKKSEDVGEGERAPKAQVNGEVVQVRKNLQETAFFYPQLRTDAEGNVRIEFTIPEALTEWKFLTLAHTIDMKTGTFSGKVKTQKDLMVMPGLPRFFRQGDELVISTKISNLSDKELNGTATLSFVNALTMQPLDIPFRMKDGNANFKVAKGESTNATWRVNVPESLYEPVIVRIVAKAGDFSDGEENALPVISNRMMVTETLPLWIHGDGTKDFSFDKLKQSGSSATLSQYKLTLEYTGNPAWYAVQALPYLMDYPYECAEQTFNRFYANALAAHIVEQSPKIEAIFKKWENESSEALLSNLEKNEELKSALLEETPWVMEAKDETEQKKRIAQLFETHKLARGLNTTMRKLKEMQLSDGAFPWFNGMYEDRYITQYILTGMGRLKHLGISDNKGNMNDVIEKALPYLDRKIKEDYDNLVKNKANMELQHIGYFEVQYLYMRSFFAQPVDKANQTAFNYYKGQAVKYWPKFNAYMKGMIALSLTRNKETKEPKKIIASLRETATKKDELGMYWMAPGYSYWWYDAPIEAQSLLIECFSEVAKDTGDIDQMRVWLLKQKQTQNWHTTKATADACYALLLNGSEWLNNEPKVTVHLGDKTIKSTEQKQQDGTGYFKTSFDGQNIQPNMGDIKLTVQDNAHSTSWGAIYWQYFEQMDKITSAATPLVVKKQLFIERNTDRGPELQEITDGNSLTIGDKVKARIEIIVDRDMEYVHLKDMRAACFEPVNVISSYKYQGGLGYYESTKDVSTNFFFGRLPKGKYVFEYPMFVTNKGDFSNGIATIQCMYAPEFSSHSAGIRVKVK